MSGKMSATRVVTNPSPHPGTSVPAPQILDHHAWSQEQAALIRAGCFDQVDTQNVADEIEDVGKSEKRELRSSLENVLVHILKWERQPQRRGRSWALSIAEHRRRVLDTLADNPSLVGKWDEIVVNAYGVARLRAARETTLSLKCFPEECPFDRDTIMDAVFDVEEA